MAESAGEAEIRSRLGTQEEQVFALESEDAAEAEVPPPEEPQSSLRPSPDWMRPTHVGRA